MSKPAYTIRQLDQACIDLGYGCVVRPLEAGWSRPHTLQFIAGELWIFQTPEDENTAIIRSALKDLGSVGYLLPSDGDFNV